MPTPRPAPRWPATAWRCPKTDHTSALGALLTARQGAVKARTAAINQIKALLVTAPAELRERYRHYTTNTETGRRRWRAAARLHTATRPPSRC